MNIAFFHFCLFIFTLFYDQIAKKIKCESQAGQERSEEQPPQDIDFESCLFPVLPSKDTKDTTPTESTQSNERVKPMGEKMVESKAIESHRIRKQITKMNIGAVHCYVCKKKFQLDGLGADDGTFLCSLECYNKSF